MSPARLCDLSQLLLATPSWFRSGKACNVLEGVLLLDLCILAAFSYDTQHVYIPIPLACVLIVGPLSLFGIFLFYKVSKILVVSESREINIKTYWK